MVQNISAPAAVLTMQPAWVFCPILALCSSSCAVSVLYIAKTLVLGQTDAHNIPLLDVCIELVPSYNHSLQKALWDSLVGQQEQQLAAACTSIF